MDSKKLKDHAFFLGNNQRWSLHKAPSRKVDFVREVGILKQKHEFPLTPPKTRAHKLCPSTTEWRDTANQGKNNPPKTQKNRHFEKLIHFFSDLLGSLQEQLQCAKWHPSELWKCMYLAKYPTHFLDVFYTLGGASNLIFYYEFLLVAHFIAL